MTVLVVTGTGTGVGKTAVAAAVAALAPGAAYVKAAQTGVPGDVPDADVVARLAGVPAYECARFRAPLSPEAAARHDGAAYVQLGEVAKLVATLPHDLVLVEGAGGLLVRYDDSGATLADLAVSLGAAALVVTAAGLGTLNATALTLEALDRRSIPLAGVVIGSWPADPGLAERSNVADLATLAGRPLAGALPEGAPDDPGFRAVARRSVSPDLGGVFAGLPEGVA